MNEVSLVSVLGVSIFGLYNYMAHSYAAGILKGSLKHLGIRAVVVIINMFLFCFSFHMQIPPYSYYIISYFLIFVEFRVLSRASIRQVFFGTSVFMLHISSFDFVGTAIYAKVLGVFPSEVFKQSAYYFEKNSYVFGMLVLILALFSSAVSTKSIIKISNTPVYGTLIATVATFMVTYTVFDVYALMRESLGNEVVVVASATFTLTTVTFYFMFLYTMHIVGINLRRRKMDGVETYYTSLVHRKQKLEQQAITDELTKLYNRRFIHEKLDELCKSKDESFGVLYLDVNKLKSINDKYGHEKGNQYLKEVALAIQRGVRESDYPARVGGDEFIVLLRDLNKENIPMVINRIENCLMQVQIIEDVAASASIGSMWVDEQWKSLGKSVILERADGYMRAQKGNYYNLGEKNV